MQPQDHRCTFEHGARRCTMPRVWSDHGNATTGYCRYHRSDANRGHGPEQDVFFDSFQKDEQTAREWLTDQYPESGESRIQRMIAERPHHQRQPYESASEYRERMMAIIRANLAGLPEPTWSGRRAA